MPCPVCLQPKCAADCVFMQRLELFDRVTDLTKERDALRAELKTEKITTRALGDTVDANRRAINSLLEAHKKDLACQYDKRHKLEAEIERLRTILNHVLEAPQAVVTVECYCDGIAYVPPQDGPCVMCQIRDELEEE